MRSLLILYGSETGTAEDVAEGIWREAKLLRVPARLHSLDDYDVENLPFEEAVVFVVATTGQGEIPPNMRSGWRRLLRKSLTSTWLQNIHFAVLGLGDSSYQKYNFAAKKVFRRLLQLGGNCLLDIGLADDQHEVGIDGAVIPWKNDFWEKLRATGLFKNMKEELDFATTLPSKYQLIFENDIDNDAATAQPQQFHEITVVSNDRVTAEGHFQDTRLVSFCTTELPQDPNMSHPYEPGDVLMVQPYNLSESIEIALDALKYTDEILDRPFRLAPSDEFVKLPPKWLIGERPTLRICFKRLFDLQMIPRKSFFQMLASISTHPAEKEKLLEFVSPEGLDDYLDYTVRCRRTTAEVLRDFPGTSSNIPPERLFDLFVGIRARAFSIASAPSMENLEILVAKVFVRIRPGTFKFPKEDKPVICVGPGTGVAPFRSYLSWRNRCKEATNSILFFGCRGKKQDFYFEQEWDQLKTTRVYTAFSRDTNEKIYVQHLISKHADEVWEVLGKQDGLAFIAGSSGDMPNAVVAALDEIAAKNGWSEGSFVAKLESSGRLQYETWS